MFKERLLFTLGKCLNQPQAQIQTNHGTQGKNYIHSMEFRQF